MVAVDRRRSESTPGRPGPKSSRVSPFLHIADPELQEKLKRVATEHESVASRANEISAGPMRSAFSRATPNREIDSPVRVRCALDDEPRGGTIREKIGQAYRVEIDGQLLTVFEPDDCWDEDL